MKAYNNFSDKYGKQYSFDNYADFAIFWFNISRNSAKSFFPKFADLQKCASNSKEARTKLNLA